MIKTKWSMLAEHVTRIVDEPSKVYADKLQIKLANIAVKWVMGAFEDGDETGHTSLVLKRETYCELIGDPTLTSTALLKPAAFD